MSFVSIRVLRSSSSIFLSHLSLSLSSHPPSNAGPSPQPSGERRCLASRTRGLCSLSAGRYTREREVAEWPFIFIFVAFPRGAVSPYIYLIAAPQTAGSFPTPTTGSPQLRIAPVARTLRLHYTASFLSRSAVSSK